MARELVFVDTGAWFALGVSSDPDHKRAAEFVSDCRRPFVTTDYIVDELLTLFTRRKYKSLGLLWLNDVLHAGACELISIDQSSFREACDVYSQFVDKDWSFTDCTSYVVMRRYSIQHAFSFDEHFRQFATVQVFP